MGHLDFLNTFVKEGKTMQKIKVAHMSDLHYAPKNLEESDRCFTAAVTEAIENKVHCAIITGDSTDHALDTHQPAVRALARQIQRLADFCPVLMLQGTFSHEPPGFLRMLSMVGSRHPITVADRVGSFGLRTDFKAIEVVRTNAQYAAVFHTLPTLNKADLAAMGCAEGDDVHSGARGVVAQVLESWAPVNRKLRSQGVPSMILSHGTVFNSITEHGIPMAGTDHELGLGSLFSSEATGVALGHIHKQQDWSESVYGLAQTVAYAGSIGRFHYGEEGNKYWLEWEIDANSAQIHKHPTPSRRTVDLVFSGIPDLDFLRARAQDCEGACVRVRYEVDEEQRQKVDRNAIRAILEAAGVQDVQIEGKTLIVQRQRAQGISTVSLNDKLAMWCDATSTPGTSELQERLALLLTKEPEQIANDVLEQLSQSNDSHSSSPSKKTVQIPDFVEASLVNGETAEMF